MEPVEEADPNSASLEGLAKAWEGVEILRDKLLRYGTLLTWSEPKLTGVINFHTMSPNAKVLEQILQLWCPQMDEPKTVNIYQVRDEVGGFCTRSKIAKGVARGSIVVPEWRLQLITLAKI